MKTIALATLSVFVCLFETCLAESCYTATAGCHSYEELAILSKCNAKFGRFERFPSLDVKAMLLVQDHLKASTEYLFMSNRFNEWMVNRKGFSKYFMKLSDDKWEQGIDLLKYSISRGGGNMADFKVQTKKYDEKNKLFELDSLGRALDYEKEISQLTLEVASHALKNNEIMHRNGTVEVLHDTDGAFANYLNEDISHRQIPRVKDLSNHIYTLRHAMTSDAESFCYNTVVPYDAEGGSWFLAYKLTVGNWYG